MYCFSVPVLTCPPKVLGLCFGANFEINWAGGWFGGEGSICWPMWFSWTGEVVALSCDGFGVTSSLSVTQGRQCGLILGVNWLGVMSGVGCSSPIFRGVVCKQPWVVGYLAPFSWDGVLGVVYLANATLTFVLKLGILWFFSWFWNQGNIKGEACGG